MHSIICSLQPTIDTYGFISHALALVLSMTTGERPLAMDLRARVKTHTFEEHYIYRRCAFDVKPSHFGHTKK